MTKTMMLITSTWGQKKTFKMIPVTTDSPYNEAIYDLDSKVLALVGKEKKQSMHMVPKIDDFGDMKPMKIGRRANGKDFQEERKTLETYYEYYLDNPNEIKMLIDKLAINAEEFNITEYLDAVVEAPVQSSIITV
jgi:hypothetical protein